MNVFSASVTKFFFFVISLCHFVFLCFPGAGINQYVPVINAVFKLVVYSLHHHHSLIKMSVRSHRHGNKSKTSRVYAL